MNGIGHYAEPAFNDDYNIPYSNNSRFSQHLHERTQLNHEVSVFADDNSFALSQTVLVIL